MNSDSNAGMEPETSVLNRKQLKQNSYISNGVEAIEGIYALGFEVFWLPAYLKHGTTILKTLASAFSTFEGFCGSLEVQLQNGWLIKNIEIFRGSIVNQFQFKKDKSGIHWPVESLNSRVFQMRPSPAYFEYYRLYPFGYPIDFNVTVYHQEDMNETTFHITKTVCNPVKLGRADAKILTGDEIPFYIRHSELDKKAWSINQVSSKYYTGSYILIPHHRSKFPEPQEN